ncbi:thiol:disulfide interchange protein DsbA/DsbL [Helicobacter sp. MIT 01-3238]|uniref:thiol:disulfide interchange protein DsbA/DsbL n=1 Tax=Helicobacter sp. MIT 01-3238 TaxID=398627 RepID=UPI001C6A0678|nr:thiol:disulfide interchange protein DsbA/DsbL [Helicobacter sp. MIT 01-3238]
MSKNHFTQGNLKMQENPKSQMKIFIKSFAQNVRDDFASAIKAKIAVVSLLAGLLSLSVAYTQSVAQGTAQNPKSDFKRYELKEGRDFIVLKEPLPNAQNSVIEIFSYACPFCYRYSKILPKVIESLPKNVEFKPYHLEKMGDYGKVASQVFAVLLDKDKKSNITTKDSKSAFLKAQKAYFSEYNIKKERWGQGKNLQAFLHTGLDAAGVKIEEFYAALQEKGVQEILRSWEAGYEVAIIQGVPAFVVNGKYLIYTKSIASLKDLEYKIDELLKK